MANMWAFGSTDEIQISDTRGTWHGATGVLSYLVPANSLSVVRVAR